MSFVKGTFIKNDSIVFFMENISLFKMYLFLYI